jgi:IMP dehydrogenase
MSREFYTGKGQYVPYDEIAKRHGGFTFDDVLLAPQPDSEIDTRKKVDLSVDFGPWTLRAPLMSAPMDTVSGEPMIRALATEGGIGTLPRGDMNQNIAICERLRADKIPFVACVGNNGDALAEAKAYVDHGAQVILVDVANGGQKDVMRTTTTIKNKLGVYVIAGNIATWEQAKSYQREGIDIARVGVGGGAACDTRNVAGVGVPQLFAVMDTAETGIYVIADGAIKEPGHAAYCLAAGAKMVMIGSRFAGTDEAPGDLIEIDGKKYKQFRGQASSSYMQDKGIEENEFRTAEGINAAVPYQKSVLTVMRRYKAGIRSSCSYAGASNLKEFEEKARFMFTTTHTQGENLPHVLITHGKSHP